MDVILSEAERLFLIGGIETGFRTDGRSNQDFRPIIIETGIVQNANGSARVKIGNTDVLVAVKAELDTPSSSQPHCGLVQFFVDCSANASPQFEGRGGEDLSGRICNVMEKSLNNSPEVERSLLQRLCLVPGRLCWSLHVDIVLLECGGANVVDCCSLAVKCSLYNVQLPNAKVTLGERGRCDVDLVDSDDVNQQEKCDATWRLNIDHVPLLVTVNKIGTASHVVDCTVEETACIKSSLVVGVAAVNEDPQRTNLTLVEQWSNCGGSLDSDSVMEMSRAATNVGFELNKSLTKQLAREDASNRPATRAFLL